MAKSDKSEVAGTVEQVDSRSHVLAQNIRTHANKLQHNITNKFFDRKVDTSADALNRSSTDLKEEKPKMKMRDLIEKEVLAKMRAVTHESEFDMVQTDPCEVKRQYEKSIIDYYLPKYSTLLRKGQQVTSTDKEEKLTFLLEAVEREKHRTTDSDKETPSLKKHTNKKKLIRQPSEQNDNYQANTEDKLESKGDSAFAVANKVQNVAAMPNKFANIAVKLIKNSDERIRIKKDTVLGPIKSKLMSRGESSECNQDFGDAVQPNTEDEINSKASEVGRQKEKQHNLSNQEKEHMSPQRKQQREHDKIETNSKSKTELGTNRGRFKKQAAKENVEIKSQQDKHSEPRLTDSSTHLANSKKDVKTNQSLSKEKLNKHLIENQTSNGATHTDTSDKQSPSLPQPLENKEAYNKILQEQKRHLQLLQQPLPFELITSTESPIFASPLLNRRLNNRMPFSRSPMSQRRGAVDMSNCSVANDAMKPMADTTTGDGIANSSLSVDHLNTSFSNVSDYYLNFLFDDTRSLTGNTNDNSTPTQYFSSEISDKQRSLLLQQDMFPNFSAYLYPQHSIPYVYTSTPSNVFPRMGTFLSPQFFPDPGKAASLQYLDLYTPHCEYGMPYYKYDLPAMATALQSRQFSENSSTILETLIAKQNELLKNDLESLYKHSKTRLDLVSDSVKQKVEDEMVNNQIEVEKNNINDESAKSKIKKTKMKI